MARRIGIYPGTFDPVHPGHIAFAKKTRRVCGLDEIIFLPEQKPRGKKKVTDITHRITLLERAIGASKDLRIARLTSEQFTVSQTLPELQKMFGNNHLTLLVGSDVARTLPYRWEGLEVLLVQVSLAIGMRSDDDPDEITEIMNRLSPYGVPVEYTLLSTPEAGMASSQIRNDVRELSCLPLDMQDYIQQYQLYT